MTAEDDEQTNNLESEENELNDLAFGMFTIFLDKHLEEKGRHLCSETENGSALDEICINAMREFVLEYPMLAEPLMRIGTAQKIASFYRNGEGIIPSKTTRSYWIQQDAADTKNSSPASEKAGKWLIFLPPDETDEAWKKIRDATKEGRLGIGAKVSTAKDSKDSHDERKVIYVFTYDWSDEDDVMKVREVLKTLGFTDRIGYKRNIDTYAGEYREKGKRVAYYSV